MEKPFIWAKLAWKHSYFGSQTPQDVLSFTSLPKGLLSKPMREEIILYSKQSLDPSFPLVLPLRPQDQIFSIYTRFPNRENSPYVTPYIWVIDSREANEKGEIEAKNCPLVPLYTSRFSHPLLSGKKLATVSIKAPDGTREEPEVPSSGQHSSYALDLHKYPHGLFEATFSYADKSSESIRFFVSNELHLNPPMAVWMQQAWKKEQVLPPSYTIQFEAVKAYWRYLFVGVTGADKPVITKTGSGLPDDLVFEPEAELVSLPNGQQAYAMVSNQPISFQHKPTYQLALGTSSSPTPVGLPHARPMALKAMPGKESGGKEQESFVSEIFVYL